MVSTRTFFSTAHRRDPTSSRNFTFHIVYIVLLESDIVYKVLYIKDVNSLYAKESNFVASIRGTARAMTRIVIANTAGTPFCFAFCGHMQSHSTLPFDANF